MSGGFQAVLLRPHARLLSLEARRRILDLLLQRFRFQHPLQGLVFDLADVLLFALDLFEHGAILLVGLDLVELVLVLRDLGLDGLDFRFQLAPLLLIGAEPDLALLVRTEEIAQLGFEGLNLGG